MDLGFRKGNPSSMILLLYREVLGTSPRKRRGYCLERFWEPLQGNDVSTHTQKHTKAHPYTPTPSQHPPHSYAEAFNQDVTKWNVCACTSFSSMFSTSGWSGSQLSTTQCTSCPSGRYTEGTGEYVSGGNPCQGEVLYWG